MPLMPASGLIGDAMQVGDQRRPPHHSPSILLDFAIDRTRDDGIFYIYASTFTGRGVFVSARA